METHKLYLYIFQNIYIFFFLLLLQYVGETYYLDFVNFFVERYIFALLHAYVRETHYLNFKTWSRIFVFEYKYSCYSIGQEKSSPILCGHPVSIEMEINYRYLHG